ncbi:hypothetical protein QO010_003308 [Caulobacter ginsengisoli]|uniref:DUF4154 domain-containing protein n=1 Tax=Caulobacter ginsengisoli TaxID=400775 RepID=A0ABU0IU40_9CAUL|nr:YfiR family protein [Caulobacter ginsengisoli]MDQ0465519.1 hypothetical protein [Caulobacter ginsengisoli]
MAFRRVPSWRRRTAGLALAVLALCAPVFSAGAAPLEWAVKATYLYKFVAFVDWPPGALGAPGEPVALCIVGPDPFGRQIDEAGAGQQIGDHPIEVRRLRQATRGSGCRVLYVRGGSNRAALAAVAGEPVLTVTDGGGGGVVRFLLTRDGKVRFSIDQAAAAANGLTLSSKLLAVAVRP